MKKGTSKRGRPRKANPLTAAERMRAYRKRKRDSGFSQPLGLRNMRGSEHKVDLKEYGHSCAPSLDLLWTYTGFSTGCPILKLVLSG